MTRVYVHSPADAFAFYTDVLGFVEKLCLPEAGLFIVAAAEDPDGTTLLLEPTDNPNARTYQAAVYAAGLPEIVFTTTDIQGDYDRLAARGVVFRQPPKTSESGTQALFEDTCGNLIQLVQKPA